MSVRELVVLGTAAQTPTRERSHNGYVLRWDGETLLFDPGEGTQRQLLLAGVAPPRIGRICITHFHGDHCLGLPGVLERLALDGVPGPVEVCFPAEDVDRFEALADVLGARDRVPLRPRLSEPGVVARTPSFTLEARRLLHRVPTLGWRVQEPNGRRMLPERLDARGVRGPAIGRLQRDGAVEVGGRRVTVDEVSVARPGQAFALVMDTALCDEAFGLAAGADLLVCEATYLERDAKLACAYRHLTAHQAGRIAAEAGARRLVLTHFSQRYADAEALAAEARAVFDGDVVAARDLQRVPLPPRR